MTELLCAPVLCCALQLQQNAPEGFPAPADSHKYTGMLGLACVYVARLASVCVQPC
jgi:hypothetical protein